MDGSQTDRDESLAGLTDDALEEELTIAATGTDEDPEREDRFDELLEEHQQRSGDLDD